MKEQKLLIGFGTAGAAYRREVHAAPHKHQHCRQVSAVSLCLDK